MRRAIVVMIESPAGDGSPLNGGNDQGSDCALKKYSTVVFNRPLHY